VSRIDDGRRTGVLMIPALMGCPTAQGHNDLLAALELPVWLGVGWTFHGGALATPPRARGPAPAP